MSARSTRWHPFLCSILGFLWTITMVTSCFNHKPLGFLYPRDSNYLVGSNVTLRCVLNVTEWQDKAQEIHKFNSSNLLLRSEKPYSLPNQVIVVNEMEIQYTIVRGQPHDSLNYYCELNLTSTKIMVCPTIINFGYEPTDVLDFKCRSNAFQNLTCSWKERPNNVSVNYILEMLLVFPHFNSSEPCPKKVNRTTCMYTLNLKPFYMRNQEKLYMKLTGNNSLGSNEQLFIIDHYSIVIAGPSRNFIESAVGTDSVSLSWMLPEGMTAASFYVGVCYRLFYKNSYQQEFQITDVGNKTQFVLLGLRPNTWYSLKLQGRSCAASPLVDDLWGPNVTLAVRTKPDIPWSPPEASDAAFDVVAFNTRRNITIYWKRVPKSEENGEKFQYSVTCMQTYIDRIRRDLNPRQEVTTSKPHYTFVNLETSSAYEFLIRSVNEVGQSTNYTRVLVERTDQMPSRPTNIRPVSIGGGQYSVSWSGDVTSADGYTLVWCQRDRPDDYRCDQHLEWKNLPSLPMTANLQLQDQNYYFAVAATSSENRVGSGLEWAPCTVDRNRLLVKVQGVSVISESSHTLNVSWKLGCEVQKAIIVEYHIYICPATCPTKTCNRQGAMVLKLKDPQAERAQVNGLEPFTNYGVSVAVESEAGHSEESDVHCHRTLSDAPSGPPRNVTILDVTNTTMKISWIPPARPNGVVSRYIVYYNDRQKTVLVPVQRYSYGPEYTMLEGLRCFTNYSIRVSACVNIQCSTVSDAQNILTEIGAPGPMDPPRTEYLNSSHVLVTWKAPELANGPLDLYSLHLYLQEGENMTKLYNVSGTSVLIPQDCPMDSQSREDSPHLFRIQAINFLNGPDVLYGPLSEASKNKLCSADGEMMNYSLVIGIFVGSTLTLAVIILGLYSVIRWMKSRVDMIKDIKVDLPSGLDTPYSNALNSYENFKNGLSRRESDPNLSPKLGYGRMDSFPGPTSVLKTIDEGFKNRHGSGASHLSAASTDQLLSKQCPVAPDITPSIVKGERNPSGDSSSGHDSLSSSLTHRTNLSSDGSTSTDDPLRKDTHGSGSRDSGLEEEAKTPTVPDYLPIASYSKLGLTGPGYLPILKGRHLNLYSHNLANSEPSIMDLVNNSHQIQSINEPPSPDVPYSKFGLSRSETDLMIQDDPESPDSPQPQDALPYSRFGLCRPPQQSPYVTVGMALMGGPQKEPRDMLLDKHSLKKKVSLEAVQDGAYSKFGLGPALEEIPPLMSNGYVTLQDIKVSKSNHSLPDLTISAGEESPAKVPVPSEDLSSKSGYLPHQVISTLSLPESGSPDLPDVVNCSSVLPLCTMLLETPEVKVQGNNGYITLNQVLTPSTEC